MGVQGVCIIWVMTILSALTVLLLAANALASLGVAGVRLVARLPMRRTPPAPAVMASDAPFVSVHVAVHDEPPALVIATLDALAAQAYPSFEVLVIDNNTPDPAMWAPVAAHAARLGPRFRFFAEQGVVGAKAGALNIALARTDPAARFVAIVDADYQATPDFLAKGVARAFAAGADFVQFPQAYRGTAGAQAVEEELGDYFRLYPRAAQAAGAPLLTGTMSIIARDALERVGGWPTGTITEDADLGVRLWAAGFRGTYAEEVVGRGLLPTDFAGLRTQRARWAAGNVQALRRMPVNRARPAEVAAIVAQLSAWPGFTALPLLALTYLAIAGAHAPMAGAIALLASGTMLFWLAMVAGRALASRRGGTAIVKSALMWTSATAWWPALTGRSLIFRRTPKAAGTTPGRALDVERIGCVLSLATAMLLMARGWPVAAAAALIGAGGLVTAPLVDRWLVRASSRAAEGAWQGA